MSFGNIKTAIVVAGAIGLLVRVGISFSQGKPPARFITSMQGVTVTEEELNRAAAPELEKLALQRLQFEANYERSMYQARENALNRLVEEKLLNAEAARRKISSAQLLANEVDQNVKDPSDQEVDQFYDANKGRITVPKEQALPQIRQYLKQQSYARVRGEFIERLKKASGVTYSIEPLRTRLETAGHPARGPAAAPVTLVEFSDFQCGYCKSISSTLEKVLQDFGPSVRLVFRQFPLNDIHPLAVKAAEASLCAGEQNKFWQMHDQMFQDQGKLSVPDLKATAARLNLDSAAFGACLDSDRYAPDITKDINDGARAGVSGTPALFINGRFLNGARPYEEIASLIKEELKAAEKTRRR